MADPQEIGGRAVEMMEALAAAYADGDVPEGPSRGIVGRRTAMDALMQIYAVLEEQLESEAMEDEVALHAMSMLLLLREYIFAVPDPPDDGAQMTNDLRDLTRMLDEAWD